MNLSRLAFLALLTSALYAQGLSNSYSGAIKVEAGAGSRTVKGVIVIKDSNGELTVSAGPNSGEQYPAQSVQRDGNTLKFEVIAGSERPRTLKFDLTVKDDTLSGKIILEREGQTQTGMLEFKKQ